MLLILVLSTLLIPLYKNPAAKIPEPISQGEKPADEDYLTQLDIHMQILIKLAEMLKEAETYDWLQEKAVEFFNNSAISLCDRMTPFTERTLEMIQEAQDELHDVPSHLISLVKELTIVLLRILKATLPRNAHPTNKQIGELATELSEVFAQVTPQNRIDLFTPFGTPVVITDENLNILMEAVKEAPKLSKRNESSAFSLSLAKRSEMLGLVSGFFDCAANHYDDFFRDQEDERRTSYRSLLLTISEYCTFAWRRKDDFRPEMVLRDIFAVFENVENVKEMIIDFVVLTEALKQADTYASTDAFVASIKKSTRLHAAAIAMQEIFTCKLARLDPDTRSAVWRVTEEFLALAKSLLAGESKLELSDVKNRIWEFMSELDRIPSRAVAVMANSTVTQECAWMLDSEIAEADLPPAPDLTDAEQNAFLEAVEQKSPKSYAWMTLMKAHVNALKRRNGLGDEAKKFLDEVTISFDNWVLHGGLRDGHEVNAIKKILEPLCSKFFALSDETKKQIIMKFPFRAIFAFTVLY